MPTARLGPRPLAELATSIFLMTDRLVQFSVGTWGAGDVREGRQGDGEGGEVRCE